MSSVNDTTPTAPRTRTTFIYGLVDPRSDGIRYVGKADRPRKRLRAHINRARRGSDSWHCAAWIRSLLCEGIEPLMRILEQVPTDRWQEAECQWIEKLRQEGCDLVNTAIGGIGGQYGPMPPEQRAKIGAAQKGRVFSEEHRRKISLAKMGHPVSEATRARMGEISRGRKASESLRRKLSEAHRNAWINSSDEYKKRFREAVRQAWIRRRAKRQKMTQGWLFD